MSHKHFIEMKFISASPTVILCGCRSGIYANRNRLTAIYKFWNENWPKMFGKYREKTTKCEGEVDLVNITERWDGRKYGLIGQSVAGLFCLHSANHNPDYQLRLEASACGE
uniref:Uncharacterized protein n=1 Tax=Schistocephalus solidus TaxID=70667 RepID=A0A0X3NVH5_SCHSO